MILESADGYRVRLWQPGGPLMEWGPYSRWADAFAVEQRNHAELLRQRAQPSRKPRSQRLPSLPLFGELP